MAARAIPKPPAGLHRSGRHLWRQIQAAVGDDFELDERETAILAMACRQADDLAALEEALDRDGVSVAGSAGQPRLNPLVTEIRQARLALNRLLGSVSIPDAEAEPRTASSLRAQNAANKRWAAVRARRGA